MEHTLRFIIIFLWCVCFGFFSVTSYLDDTITTYRSAMILIGLLASLGLYCAIEWFAPMRKTLKGRPGARKEPIESTIDRTH